MDCKFVDRSLSDYLSGELPGPQVLEVEDHLRGCKNCQEILNDFQRILAACRSLPDFEAREDNFQLLKQKLSPGTHEIIADKRRLESQDDLLLHVQAKLAFYRRVAVAVAAMAMISVSLWIGQFIYSPPVNSETSNAPAALASLEIQRAELHYQNAIESLAQVLENTKQGWNPEVRRVVDQNLEMIDKAIAECQVALRRDPRNLEAGAYLLAAYRKKVDLMRSMLSSSTYGS
jgi:tetratricopeptide (TPR) repeat protein